MEHRYATSKEVWEEDLKHRIKELTKQNETLLAICKSAYKDYVRVFDGRGMPSVIVLNKLGSVVGVEDE